MRRNNLPEILMTDSTIVFSLNNICPTSSRFSSFFSVGNEEAEGARFSDARNSENNYNIVREEDSRHARPRIMYFALY